MDPRILQKQAADNAKEIQNYLEDLKHWESDMKRLESQLQLKEIDVYAPPIRSKKKRLSEEKQNKQQSMTGKSKRINSYDYASWEKFDVDKACEDVEAHSAKETEEKSSEDEELLVRQREEAMYEKNMGNELVKSQKWKEAIQHYNRAIKCYPYDAIFYANRALCCLKTGMLKLAEADCTAALQLDPNYVKAYQRRASARTGLGQLHEARADLIKVMELEPKNIASKAELTKIERNLKFSIEPKKIKEQCEKQDEKSASPDVKKEKKVDQLTSEGVQAASISKGKTESAIANIEAVTIESQQKEAVSISNYNLEQESKLATKRSVDFKIKTAPNIKLVQAVHKPPHLRSKKQLKRIEIQEVLSSSALITVQTANDFQEEVRTECHHKDVQSASLSKQLENVRNTDPLTRAIDEITNIPPVPYNYVQFLTAWKKVKTSQICSYYFLKQIDGEALPRIFGDSLETSILSEMISIFKTKFIEDQEKVYPYLLGLSEVQRFSTLTLFLSSNDKSGIKKLLKYCEEQGECTSEAAGKLMKKYEL